MSPYLFSADLAATATGTDAAIDSVFSDYADALRQGDFGRMQLIREYADAIDPELVDELDGFDYPAAA